jgi:hypothetical protein
MARDKVHPLKFESPASGGTELDDFPTAMDPNEDHLDARGVNLQNDTSSDEAVGMERVNSELVFRDSAAGVQSLSDLLATGSGISESTHKSLRDLIHFIDGGPADGFASGAFKETLPVGAPFHSSEIWWESAAKVEKIVELTITRNANQTPATEVWKMYDTDGTTVLVTVTDTMTYSGVFESTRTRTWA